MAHRILGIVLTTLSYCAAQPVEIEKRISDLLQQMTLEEKLGQISQSTSMRAPISEDIKNEIRKGRWGSFLNAGLPADRLEAQRIAVKESRLGIPLVFGRDVVHGYRTVFPIPLGQSASWDPDLIAEAARVAAKEARGELVHWSFAPMIDITRDPRWGRVAETLGEDPYLTSVLGAAMIQGFQGKSIALPESVAACAKHYVGYGAAEAGRDYNSTFIPEGQLREVFLPPFQAAVRAGVATLMTSFNAINGVPASGNEFTIREVLRKEWKFEGLVVSDYESVLEMVKHGTAASPAEAAAQALRAGVDMEMVSTTYFDHLKALVEKGQIGMEMIDEAVRAVLRFKFRLDLWNNPLRAPIEATVNSQSLDVAKRLARGSMVLLKNDKDVLPLPSSTGSIAVIGPLADSAVDQMGSWVMDARPEEAETPLAAIRKRIGADRVRYVNALANSRDMSREKFAAAIEAARAADVVVLFLGEEQILSGEAHSRAFLNLPGAQEALVEEVTRLGKPTVAVIFAGRPLTFQSVSSKVGAVLYGWHPGSMGGPAVAELLFGDHSPSGKLTITFPRTVGQIPIYYSQLNTGRPAATGDSGIPLGTPLDPKGYTSRYLDVDVTPEYPFGYGLSYTTFDYGKLKLSSEVLRKGGALTVGAEIANTGKHASEEIVQLYVRDVVASVSRPLRELKGFRRVYLKPGERQTVSFTLTTDDLTFYNTRLLRITEPGEFQVWIAPDAARGVEGRFRLE